MARVAHRRALPGAPALRRPERCCWERGRVPPPPGRDGPLQPLIAVATQARRVRLIKLSRRHVRWMDVVDLELVMLSGKSDRWPSALLLVFEKLRVMGTSGASYDSVRLRKGRSLETERPVVARGCGTGHLPTGARFCLGRRTSSGARRRGWLPSSGNLLKPSNCALYVDDVPMIEPQLCCQRC